MSKLLGDGVYVDKGQGSDLVLTTEDGFRVTNRIVLNFDVYLALTQFVEGADARVGDADEEFP